MVSRSLAQAVMTLLGGGHHDPRRCSIVGFGGSVGAGEACMDGFWSGDDLTMMMRIGARNQPLFEGRDKVWADLGNGFTDIVG